MQHCCITEIDVYKIVPGASLCPFPEVGTLLIAIALEEVTLPALELQVYEILQYKLFCVQFLSLSGISVRFIHAAAYNSGSFLFIPE